MDVDQEKEDPEAKRQRRILEARKKVGLIHAPNKPHLNDTKQIENLDRALVSLVNLTSKHLHDLQDETWWLCTEVIDGWCMVMRLLEPNSKVLVATSQSLAAAASNQRDRSPAILVYVKIPKKNTIRLLVTTNQHQNRPQTWSARAST
jgi:hypothetical protein